MDSINDKIINCIDCGTDFTFTKEEQRYYKERNFCLPKRCKSCRKKRKAIIEKENQHREAIIWQIKEQEKINALLKDLPYNKLSRIDVRITEPQSTLYVIGNGFDITHGVLSRYSNFRDSMGKNNSLRRTLETYLKSDSLWCDFEEALAHIDASAMLGTVDMWMDIMGAYEPDASAADFCLAYDTATSPAQEITYKLPKIFRTWVETLKPTKEAIYKELLHKDGTYLNFNYTEFIETLYKIPTDKITYIHGCRKNKKDELVLGHAPGSGDEDDWTPTIPYPNFKSKRKNELLDGAIDSAVRNLNWYNDETTKKSDEIIENNKSFFTSLSNIKTIVVLGHSLSKVDYPYFYKIIVSINEKPDWLISWYSSRDLKNIRDFANKMKIKPNKIALIK